MSLIYWIKSKIRERRWNKLTQVEKNRVIVTALIMGRDLAVKRAKMNYERRLFDK